MLIWGNDENKTKEKLNQWNFSITEYKLNMNMVKAVTRRISRNLNTEVKTQVNNTMVKQVDNFLGGWSDINSRGKINGEVNTRTQNSSKFYKIIKEILQNREISKQCKRTIYKVYLTKILNFGDVFRVRRNRIRYKIFWEEVRIQDLLIEKGKKKNCYNSLAMQKEWTGQDYRERHKN
jgi:hypothetical protein